uniref:Uncharacterized protein n=1 Tax=viral metagenome TaxID=1070528 RepID=A0A6M3JGN4_9ZZZZ
MEEEKKFWVSKVEVFKNLSLEQLRDTLNAFYKQRWVVATQVFKDGEKYDAIAYYKEKPN